MRDDPHESAYLATDYWVEPEDSENFAIRIGKISGRLGQLLSEKSAESWAFISAENPQSTLISKHENEVRTRQFVTHVVGLGKVFLRGRGVGRESQWPAEASLLIFDVSLSSARKIARLFDQKALVFGRANEKAELIWVD